MKIWWRNITCRDEEVSEFIEQTIHHCYSKHLKKSLVNELRRELSDTSEERAVQIFSKNLKQLLLTPPIKDNVVLGIDPGFKSGSKIAVVDSRGNFLFKSVIYPLPPKANLKESTNILLSTIKKYKVNLISIGNGTGGREVEEFVSDFIEKHHVDVSYFMVYRNLHKRCFIVL